MPICYYKFILTIFPQLKSIPKFEIISKQQIEQFSRLS